MDRWVISGSLDTTFEFDYAVRAEDMRGLYEKAKRDQWNASRDIAWDTPGTDDGRVLADELIDIHGSPLWERLGEAVRRRSRRRSLVCGKEDCPRERCPGDRIPGIERNGLLQRLYCARISVARPACIEVQSQ